MSGRRHDIAQVTSEEFEEEVTHDHAFKTSFAAEF